MEFVEFWEGSLAHLVSLAQLVLESISVLCVVVGLLKTLQVTLQLRLRYRHGGDFPFNQIRIQFGTWLALALEFQLGSDVLATTVAPTIQDLGKLAVVAVVRTFLNYFLSKELEAEIEMENRKREQDRKFAQD